MNKNKLEKSLPIRAKYDTLTGMETHRVFARKARIYARYRWDYAPEAVAALFAIAGLDERSCVADLGAGTGILTRHFIGRVGLLYAIEPNDEMRREAEQRLNGCQILAASAERTTLPDHSVDLIAVAQAVHWFDPLPARQEFQRILKPGSWLALLSNAGQDEEVGRAIDAISTPEYGVRPLHPADRSLRPAPGFYFGAAEPRTLAFPFTIQQDWPTFIGALLSTSFMPDEDDPCYPRFEQAARDIFFQHSQDGVRTVHGVTTLVIGQPDYQGG